MSVFSPLVSYSSLDTSATLREGCRLSRASIFICSFEAQPYKENLNVESQSFLTELFQRFFKFKLLNERHCCYLCRLIVLLNFFSMHILKARRSVNIFSTWCLIYFLILFDKIEGFIVMKYFLIPLQNTFPVFPESATASSEILLNTFSTHHFYTLQSCYPVRLILLPQVGEQSYSAI